MILLFFWDILSFFSLINTSKIEKPTNQSKPNNNNKNIDLVGEF